MVFRCFDSLTPCDFKQFLNLQNTAFPENPWSEQSAKHFCSGKFSQCLFDFQDDHLRGYLITQTLFEEAEIISVATAPRNRGAGIARHLLETFLEQFQKNEGERILLEVAETNLPARALYQSLGFETISVRKGYYLLKGERINALQMARRFK